MLLQAATGHNSVSQAKHDVLKEFCEILQAVAWSPGDTLGSAAREPGVMPASFHSASRENALKEELWPTALFGIMLQGSG